MLRQARGAFDVVVQFRGGRGPLRLRPDISSHYLTYNAGVEILFEALQQCMSIRVFPAVFNVCVG